MTPVRLEPAASLSRVKHSTTEQLSPHCEDNVIFSSGIASGVQNFVATDVGIVQAVA